MYSKTPAIQSSSPSVSPVRDINSDAILLGLKIITRSLEFQSLAKLYYFLTNDTRTLIEFDRCHLFTHFGGTSSFTATNNQPSLEPKSGVQIELNALAPLLFSVQKAQLLSSNLRNSQISEQDLSIAAREALSDYIEQSGCNYLFCVPLEHNRAVIGHLVMEFFGENLPKENQLRNFLAFSPFLATALSDKWILENRPQVWTDIDPTSAKRKIDSRFFKKWGLIGLALATFIIVFFLMPYEFTAGGEAVTTPFEKHMAFSKIDGIVQQVSVVEGDTVDKGQILANLDPTELNHKIGIERRHLEILTKEMKLLIHGADEVPARLAESELVELKRQSKIQEIRFLEWQKQFIQIPAPISGTVLTKDIDGFVGKKFKAGEVFAEIAAPGELYVDVYIPEDRIGYVRIGQKLKVFLNSSPSVMHELIVSEVAPIAEVLPRLGAVYRVRAPFVNAPKDIKLGMKGFGKIVCSDSSLASVVKQRMLTRWNQWILQF